MTGRANAYLESMAAWTPDRSLRALTAWPALLWDQAGVIGLLLLMMMMVVVAFYWMVRRRGARAWSMEVRSWAWAYPLFLLLATGPGVSSIRHAVLAFPILWPFVEKPTALAERRMQLAFVAVLAVFGLISQWFWISNYLVVTASVDGTFP